MPVGQVVPGMTMVGWVETIARHLQRVSVWVCAQMYDPFDEV